MTEFVIGVDIGTGSTKALAVNFNGKVIASSQFHYPTLNPGPDCYEQDPERVWIAFVNAVNQLVTTLNSNPIAVVLSSAMHSVIPVDQHGKGLHNMIIWADNRSGDIARRIHQSAAGEMLYEETGTPIHAMSPLCKLVWIKENDPNLHAATFKFISIKEYIWYKLFQIFEVDYSIASATGLMNILKFEWSTNALELAEISTSHLSTLVNTNHSRTNVIESSAQALGIKKETTFVIGASDGCLANLGSFATSAGVAALTIGTSAAVRVASTSPVYNFNAMTFNYLLDEKTFICGGPSNNGGVVLKWFAETFLQKPLNTVSDYEVILKSLDVTSPGAEGLIFLPYLFGERAPIWNSDACGVFFGVKGKHTQHHFTRAVIEGISMALLDIGENMTESGTSIKQIHVSGGFVKSIAWLQVLSNMFNKKICLINSDDASAIGAAYLGLKTLTIAQSYNDLKPDSMKEILPQDAAVEVYKNQFLIYRDLYEKLKNVMV